MTKYLTNQKKPEKKLIAKTLKIKKIMKVKTVMVKETMMTEMTLHHLQTPVKVKKKKIQNRKKWFSKQKRLKLAKTP